MSWEQINVNDLPVEETKERSFEPVPDGRYNLQILSASENTFRPGGINITTAVAGEGQYVGRRIFVDLPNVDEQPWAGPVLKRMLDAMGAEMAAYADPIATLNTISQNGHSRFAADVYTREYTKKDGSLGRQNKVSFKTIGPAL